MRILFAGTPDFAAASLAALLSHPGAEIVGVYTQPDKPAGRGQQLRESAVKALAASHGLRIFQPRSLRDPWAIDEFRAQQADLLVVAAYGQILPLAVLEAPRFGAINVHASLLPRWRGAAPIQRAIMAGDTESGITIMRVVEKLDAGPMIVKHACPIGPQTTGGSLHDALAELGGEALLEALDQIIQGTARETVQDESLVTYARKIERPDRQVDWTQPAETIERLVRAMAPAPLATTRLRELDVNLLEVALAGPRAGLDPGATRLEGDALLVGTGEGALRIDKLQPAGKARMTIREFLNGYRSRFQA